MGSKNNDLEVFSKVIRTIALDAASKAEGIRLKGVKRNKEAVSVYFLPNEKVTVDICLTILQGYTVPETVALVQESVKNAIEDATKFKVNSVNVDVVGTELEGV